MTYTDGVYIDGRRIDTGDCSGPRSAREVLMNPDVDAAVLETARGGILREGLGFDRCDVAVVTNIGEGDHLGLDDINTVEGPGAGQADHGRGRRADRRRGAQRGRSARGRDGPVLPGLGRLLRPIRTTRSSPRTAPGAAGRCSSGTARSCWPRGRETGLAAWPTSR